MKARIFLLRFEKDIYVLEDEFHGRSESGVNWSILKYSLSD